MTSAAARSPARPHAPELSWTRRLLGRFHVTGVFWYRLPYWGARHGLMPPSFYPIGVRFFATAFYLFLWRIGRAIASNLEPVLGPCGPIERQLRMWRTLHDFAWCHGARYEQLTHRERFEVEIEGGEHLPSLEGREGILFVTAHLGLWEMASQPASQGLRRTVHVVREEEIDPEAQAFVRKTIRELSTPDIVTHFLGDDPGLALELADALRRGELVALQADRPRTGGRSRTATLFGRPMPLPIGPAALARATGVPCVPVFSFREGRFRYRLVVREPFRVARTADRERDLAEAVDRIAAEIEWAIRQRPHQWFCFRKLWD